MTFEINAKRAKRFVEQFENRNTKLAYYRDLLQTFRNFRDSEISLSLTNGAENRDIFLAFLDSQNLAQKTRIRKISTFSNFCAFHKIPFEPIKIDWTVRDKSNKYVSDPRIIDEILKDPTVSLRTKAAIAVMTFGGYRISDVCDMHKDYCPVFGQFDEGRKYVKDYLDLRIDSSSSALFLNCLGRPLSRFSFWKDFRVLEERYSGDINPTSVRASWVIRHFDAGYSIEDISVHTGIDPQSIARILNGFRDVLKVRN